MEIRQLEYSVGTPTGSHTGGPARQRRPVTPPARTSLRSVSTFAWKLIPPAATPVRLLGTFRRVVDLALGDEVLALVTPEVGNGPFHLVLDAFPQINLPPTFHLWREGPWLHVGPWLVDLPAPVPLWNPTPRWKELAPSPAALERLRAVALEEARRRAVSPFAALLLGEALPPVDALRVALGEGDLASLRPVVARVAGWGPGLTPSGDDFLAGVLLGLRAGWGEESRALDTGGGSPSVCDFAFRAALPEAIYRAAAPRTTRLSRAFLHAAREGRADARWHRLLGALAAGTGAEVARSARAVLAFGASSGLDMVSGFLWMQDFAREVWSVERSG